MSELEIKHLVKSSQKHLQKLRWGQPLLDTSHESRAELEAINGGPIFGREANQAIGGRSLMMHALFSPAIRKIARKMRQGRQNFMEERLNKHLRGHQLHEDALTSLKTSASALALGVADACRTQEPIAPALATSHHKMLEAKNEMALAISKHLVSATIPQNSPQTPPLNHPKGAVVYYGSAIALQANHGGYMGLNQHGRVDAVAIRPTPPCLLTLWNMMDLGDVGAIRYGDQVWLQCSRYELLGTSAMPHDVGAEWNAVVGDIAEASRGAPNHGGEQQTGPDWEAYSSSFARERRIARRAAETLAQGPITQPVGGRIRETVGRLVAVPCGGASAVGARASARWVILHRKHPHATIGTHIMHEDDIVLQQEELYVSSRKKDCCELRVPRTDVAGKPEGTEKLNSFRQVSNGQELSSIVDDTVSVVFKSGLGARSRESTQPIASSLTDIFDKEYSFTLRIVTLPQSSLDERKRMVSAMQATIQLTKSKDRALQQVPALMRMRLEQRLDAKANEQAILARTLNERGSLEAHMAEKYRTHPHKDWSGPHATSTQHQTQSPALKRVLLRSPTTILPSEPINADAECHESWQHSQPCTDPRKTNVAKQNKLACLAQSYTHRVSQSAIMLDTFKMSSIGQVELLRRTKATRTIQGWCKRRFMFKWGHQMARLDQECISKLDNDRRKDNSARCRFAAREHILQDFFITDAPLAVASRANLAAPPPASAAYKLRRTVGSAFAISQGRWRAR